MNQRSPWHTPCVAEPPTVPWRFCHEAQPTGLWSVPMRRRRRRRGRLGMLARRGTQFRAARVRFRAVRGRHRFRDTPDRSNGVPSRWRYRGTCRGEHRRERRQPLAHLRVRRRHLGAEPRHNARSRRVVGRRGQHRRTRPAGHLRARPSELVRSRIGDGTRTGGSDVQLQPASQSRNPPCRRRSGRERRRPRRPGKCRTSMASGCSSR